VVCQTKFLFGKAFPELEARRRPGKVTPMPRGRVVCQTKFLFGKVFPELEARRRPGKVTAPPRDRGGCQTIFLFGKVFPELEARRRPGEGHTNTEGSSVEWYAKHTFCLARFVQS
jgi:hypothetical protein